MKRTKLIAAALRALVAVGGVARWAVLIAGVCAVTWYVLLARVGY